MKNLFVFLMMLLVVPVLRAQPFKKVMKPAMNNRMVSAQPDNHGGFYLLSKQGRSNLAGANTFLYHMNDQCDTLWSVLLPFAPKTTIKDMLVLEDGDVIICGTVWECDIDPMQFITRISLEGETKWLTHHNVYDHDDNENKFIASPMTLTGDGNVYLLGLYKVYTVSLNSGKKVHQFDLPYDNDNEYFSSAYNFYYHVYQNELYFTGQYGIQGYQLQTKKQTEYVQNDQFSPILNYIFPIDFNRILFYNQNGATIVLNIDGTLSDPDLGVVECIAKHPDGRLAVYGYGSVRVYDGNFTLLNSFEPELQALYPEDVFWLDSTIVLAGNEKHIEEDHLYTSSLWVQTYDLDGNTLEVASDASVTEVVVDQEPVAHEIASTTWHADYAVSNGSFSAVVENSGDVVLQSVTLNASYYGYDYYGICFQFGTLDSTYFNLNLQPGQDTLLYLGNMGTVVGDTFEISLQPWQFCIWTSDPNHQADADISNNRSCVEIMLNLLPEPEPNPDAFSLFPNPTSNACTITWGENLRPETVQVYDLLGRLMRTETVDASAGRHELNLEGLIRGLYVVETGGVVVRLVKL